MKLLLHICCAPCLIWPYKSLTQKGYLLEGIFYNPNIHPYLEYLKRKDTLLNYAIEIGLKIRLLDYEIRDFFRAIHLKEDKPLRCEICWYLRLKKTAEIAREEKFDYFSTTLLVSPYQNYTTIVKIGENLEEIYGIRFYFEDFRAGFRESHLLAKQKGFYCQNYCGCIYSQLERYITNV